MNYFEDLTPEARALIKGREKVPKAVAAKLMGCRRGSFDRIYVNTGLIKGFVPEGGIYPLFYVRDLYEIRNKEHAISKEKELVKEERRKEASKFNDNYFTGPNGLFERAKALN
jgi:hypothetical protein